MNISESLLERDRKNLISIDYGDVLTQRAYLALYAGKDSAGNGILERFVFEAGANVTSGVPVETDEWENVIDMDFDIDIKAPQIIEGNGYVNLSFGQYNNGAGDHIRCRVKLAYYRGSSETVIATSSYVTDTSEAEDDVRALFKLTIPNTSLRVGDKLRLIAEVEMYTTAPGAGVGYLGHDPVDTASAYGSHGTLLKLWVPFKPVL